MVAPSVFARDASSGSKLFEQVSPFEFVIGWSNGISFEDYRAVLLGEPVPLRKGNEWADSAWSDDTKDDPEWEKARKAGHPYIPDAPLERPSATVIAPYSETVYRRFERAQLPSGAAMVASCAIGFASVVVGGLTLESWTVFTAAAPIVAAPFAGTVFLGSTIASPDRALRRKDRQRAAERVVFAARSALHSAMPGASGELIDRTLVEVLQHGSQTPKLPPGVLRSRYGGRRVLVDASVWAPVEGSTIARAKMKPWSAGTVPPSKLAAQVREHVAGVDAVVGEGNTEWVVLRDDRTPQLLELLEGVELLAASPSKLARDRAPRRLAELRGQADLLMAAADEFAAAELDAQDREVLAHGAHVKSVYVRQDRRSPDDTSKKEMKRARNRSPRRSSPGAVRSALGALVHGLRDR